MLKLTATPEFIAFRDSVALEIFQRPTETRTLSEVIRQQDRLIIEWHMMNNEGHFRPTCNLYDYNDKNGDRVEVKTTSKTTKSFTPPKKHWGRWLDDQIQMGLRFDIYYIEEMPPTMVAGDTIEFQLVSNHIPNWKRNRQNGSRYFYKEIKFNAI